MSKRILLLIFVTLSFVLATKAQVTGVNFQIKYDTSKCNYSCYIIIKEGSTNPAIPSHRVQFNANYTIAVPKGSVLTRDTFFNPIQLNANYNGTNPMKWEISVVNTDCPMWDYYSFVPKLSPVSYYNNLNVGDTVKLFSVKISPFPSCGEKVRPFINGVDPSSSDPCSNGGDFSNGFTIGSPEQDYLDNEQTKTPDKPKATGQILCTGGLQLDLKMVDTSRCQSPFSYAWTGPGYSGTDQDINIPAASNPIDGNYQVIIQDALGCKDTFDFNVTGKPNAGADNTACAGTSITLSATPTGGTWTSHTDNTTGGAIASTTANTATINYSPTATGAYKYIYTYLACSDTIEVKVAAQDAGPDPLPQSCYQSATVSLNAGSDFGMWKLKSGPGPGTPTIVDPNNKNTNVINFPAEGTYIFEWVNGTCSDEVTVVLGGTCFCTITNTINQPLVSEKCLSDNGPFTIDGAPADPVGGMYKWTYSSNNGVSYDIAPGTNNTEDYTTTTLPVGTYIFVRRYITTTPLVCDEPSNSVTLIVHPNANAGSDQVDNCAVLPGGTVTMNATGIGTWSQKAGPSGGNSIINSFNQGNTEIEGFTAPGVYTFEWMDDNGCVDEAQVTIIEKPNAGTDKFLPCVTLPTSISMDATGTGTWTALSSNPSLSPVIVSPNSPTTNVVNFTIPGIYNFTWGTATCKDTVEINITEKVDAGIDQTLTCVNLKGGMANLSANVDGGNWVGLSPTPGIYTILASNDKNAQVFDFTEEGDYIFRYTANGCSDDVKIKVISRKRAGSDVNIDCTDLPGGSVPLTALGRGVWSVLPGLSAGTANFVNDTINTTTVYDFTLPGDYYLQWKSGVNCFDTVKINIKGFPNPGPNQNLDCIKLNTGSVFMNAVGNGVWSNGANPGGTTIVNSNQNNTEIKGFSAPGIYTFQWTVNGCTKDVQVNVTSRPDAGTDKTITCVTLPGGSVSMNAVGIGIWSKDPSNPGNVTINSPGNPSSMISNFPLPGIYKFIWTVGLCTDTVAVNVSDVTDAGPDQSFLCTDPMTVTAILNGSGTGGLWTALDGGIIGDAGSSSTTVTGFTNPGVYNFEWDIAGCKDQMKITITNGADAGNDPAVVDCFVGGQAILNANNGSGTWTSLNAPGSVSISPLTSPSSIVKDFTGPGTYKFMWTSGGCKDTVDVVVDDDCPCPISNNSISGDADFCNVSGLVNISGSAATPASGNYLWQVKTGNGAFLNAVVPNSNQNYSINNLSVGQYFFRRIFTTTAGFICSDTSNEVIINVKPKPNAGGDQTISCTILPGGSVGVIASTGVGNWLALNGGSVNPDNANVATLSNFPSSGTYNFEWTVDGCKDTMKVIVTEAAEAGIDGSLTCVKLPGGSYVMNASGSGTWTPASNPTTTTITLNTDPKTTVTNFGAAGAYKYYWTASNGCKDSVIINVTGKPNAGSDINNSCVTLPASVSLNAIGSGTWAAINGGNVVSGSNPTSVVDALALSGQYLFEWTNNACTDTVAVIISEKANAGIDQNVDCFASGNANLLGNGNGTWSLLLPNTSTLVGSGNAASVSFSSAGTYKYIYTLGNCKDTVTVNVGNNCPCPIASNDIQQPSINEFCVESPVVNITGLDATPMPGVYKWLYNGAVAPGTNSNKDYATQKLAVGTHTFSRVYTTTSQPICTDTSNIITIIVHPKPNAGPDQLAKCVTLPGGSINTNAVGSGVWSQINATPTIAQVNNPATAITGFPTEGTFNFVWTVNNCTDTMSVIVSEGVEAGPSYDTKCIAFPATIQLNAVGTGKWIQLINPSGTLTVDNIPNPTVTGINVPGFYTYKWERNGCDDIVTFEVSRKVETGPDQDLGCNALTGGSTTLNAIIAGSTSQWTLLTPSPGTVNIVQPTNTSTIVNQFSNEGTYNFEFSSDGCKDTTSVIINKKPSAGQNPLPVECFVTGTANLNASGTGQWILSSGGTLDFSDKNNPNSSVYNFSGPGNYTLIWRSVNNCEDTIQLSVGNNCPCQIQNNEIAAPTPNTFCVSSGFVQLIGTTPTPSAGTFLWQYSNGTNPFGNAGGINNDVDYTTTDLGLGIHRFRRIYTTTSLPICSDTSEIIAITVESKPNAGIDIVNECVDINAHSVTLNGSGTVGQWVQREGPSTLDILGETNPKASIANFQAEGTYLMEWTVNGCKDSVEVYVSKRADAGLDQTALCIALPGGSKTIIGNDFGTWAYIGAGIAPSYNPSSSTTTVSNFSTSGIYNFQWTTTNGCKDTVEIKVTEKADAGIDFPLTCVILNQNSTNLDAKGTLNSGSWNLSSTPPSGSANISNINDPQTTVTNFSKEGNYVFEWTTSEGCKADVIVVVSEAADAGNNAQAIDCYVTGSVLLDAKNSGYWLLSSGPSGGTANIEFPNNKSTKVDGFTKEGIYIFTWTATNGCEDIVTVTVGKKCDCPVSNNNIVPPSGNFCQSSGILSLDGTPATPAGGSYLWLYSLNNANIASFEPAVDANTNEDYTTRDLGLGDHRFRRVYTMNVAPFCSDTSSEILIKVNANPIAGTDKTLSCISLPGGSVAMNAIGSGNWTKISGPNVSIPFSTSPTTEVKDFSAEGVYKLQWENNGCKDTVNITITEKAKAGIDQSQNCISLPGGQITMAAIGTGTWSALDGARILNASSPTTTIDSFKIEKSYRFIWNNTNGCKDTMAVTVTAKPNAGADQVVQCYLTGSAVVTASSLLGTWSEIAGNSGTSSIVTSNNSSTIINNFSKDGVYRYLWTDANGCKDTLAITVGDNCPCTVVNNTLNPINNKYCEGQVVIVNINGSAATPLLGSYRWEYSIDGGSFNPVTPVTITEDLTTTNLGVGQHRFRRIYAITAPNCEDTSNVVLITVNAKPNAGIDKIANCVNLPGGSITMDGVGNNGAWTKLSGGGLNIVSNSIGNTIINNFDAPGDYILQWQVNGCTDTAKITVIPAANAGPDATVKCFARDSVIMNALGNGTWNPLASNPGTSDLINPSSPNAIVKNFEKEGIYQFVWTLTASSCADTVTLSVGKICVCQIANNQLTPINNQYCEGENTMVTITGSDATPAIGSYEWQYSFNGGAYQAIVGATSKTYTNAVSLPVGDHRFIRIFSVATPTPCSDTSNVVLIKVNAKPDAGPDQIASCVALPVASVTMNAVGANGTWTAIGTITPTIVQNNIGNTIVNKFTQEGDYFLKWQINGCADTAKITVIKAANAGLDQTVKCFSTSTASLTALDVSGAWTILASNPGTSTIVNENTPNAQAINFEIEGVYKYLWTATSGCTDTVAVTVGKICDCTIDNNILTPITQEFCQGESVQVTIDGSDATPTGGTYQWQYSFNNGIFSDIPSATGKSHTNSTSLPIGVHRFVRLYTVSTPSPCSDTSNIVLIKVNAKPNAGLDATLSCIDLPGGSIKMNAIGAGKWSPLGTVTIVDDMSGSTIIKDFPIEGKYNFEWTVDGCKDTVAVTIFPSANAGIDASIQCYSSDCATLQASGVGQWNALSSNPGSSIFGSVTNPTTTVCNFSIEGDYKFEWTNLFGCSDTVTITVGKNCPCNIALNNINPIAQQFCQSSGNVLIQGSDATPATGTYTWLYSSDGINYKVASLPNNNRDYTTQDLGIGQHSFKRIFEITSPVNCVDTSNAIAIVVNARPNAGADAIVKCFTNGSVPMNASSINGTWTGLATETGSYTISNDKDPKTLVDGFVKEGIYTLIWTDNNTGCADSVVINVGKDCGCAISGNNLIQPAQSNFCDSTGTVVLNGTPASPSGGSYEWQYSKDALPFVTAIDVNNLEDYTINNLTVGNYRFRRIYDISTCKDTSNIVAIDVNTSPDLGSDINKLCVQLPSVSEVVNNTGNGGIWAQDGNNPSTVSITNNLNSSTINGFTKPGDYNFIWTVNGCRDTLAIKVSEAANAGVDKSISCLTLPGGEVIMSANAGISNALSKQWQFVSGPGNYTITDDKNPLTAIKDFDQPGIYKFTWAIGSCMDEVAINVSPKVDAGNDAAVQCYKSDVATLSAPSLGGAWSIIGSLSIGTATIQDPTKANTQVTNFSKEGIYYFEWTVGTCSDTVKIEAMADCAVACIIDNNNINTPDGSFCITNQNVVIDGEAVSQSGGTYLWQYSFNNSVFGSANPINNGEDYVANSLPAGKHRFRRIYALSPSCQDTSKIVTINIVDKPAAPTILTNQTLCEGQTLKLNTKDSIGYTYIWSGPNNFNAAIHNPSINNVKLTDAGDYKLILKIADCISDEAIINIKINPTPATPILNPIFSACESKNITIIGPSVANASYKWTGPAPTNKVFNTKDININSLSSADAGKYTLVVSVNGCASLPTSTDVTVNAKPVATINAVNAAYCEGDKVTISAPVVAQQVYKWTMPSGALSSSSNIVIDSITKADQGTYKLTVALQGCESDTSRVSLNVNLRPAPQLFTNNGPVCEGEELILTAPSVPSYTYKWIGPKGAINTSSNNVSIKNTTVLSHSGTYSLIIIDGNNCKSDTSTNLAEIQSKPTITAPASINCFETDSVTLSVLSGSSIGTWTATSSEVKIISVNGLVQAFGFAKEGTYDFNFDNGVCNASLSVEVGKNCPCNLAENAISQPIPSVFCTISDEVTITGNDANIDEALYVWQVSKDGAPYVNASGNYNGFNYTTDKLDVGQYSIRRILKNRLIAACLDSSNAVTLRVVDKTKLNITLDEFSNPSCMGDSINLTVKNPIPNAIYLWSTAENLKLISKADTVSAVVAGDAPGKHKVFVRLNAKGCEEIAPAESEVIINPNPSINLGQDTTFCSIDGEVVLHADGYESVEWSDGSSDTEFTVTEKGLYSVQVTDTLGCRARDEIRIKEFCCKITAPNIIMAQEGSVNSEFKLTDDGCVLTSKLRIYDRWGNLMYISEDKNKTWDATFNGKPVDQGVYVFIFEYSALDADDNVFKDKLSGDITVIRKK